MTTAQHAIKAAQHAHIWGRFTAKQYCVRRRIPLRLLCIAKQLEATKNLK